jgi:VanZ family protein
VTAAGNSSLLTHHLPALAWAGLVAVALIVPVDARSGFGGWFSLGPWIDPHLDKVAHFGSFAVLAALAARSFGAPAPAGWRRAAARRPLASAVLVAIAYGGLTEGMQLAAAGRDASAGDLAADAAGALAAAALLALVRRRRSRAPSPFGTAGAVRGGAPR